jgi:hypothetical protein
MEWYEVVSFYSHNYWFREIKEVRKGKQSKEFEKYSEDFRNVEVSRIEMETMILKTKEDINLILE